MNKNREVYYRPNLAETLQKALDVANKFYAINFQQAYYEMLATIETDEDRKHALQETAKCFGNDNPFGMETFEEYYERQYRIDYISPARAADVFYTLFANIFEDMKNNIDRTGLTGLENFMVDSFFGKLTSPTRNPNIKIPEGETQCYYDRKHEDFYHDLKLSVEYINRECSTTIEIFNTPD